MEVSNIISLGSWCRCAYQVRHFFANSGAYPFDWTITPFDSLKLFLELKDEDAINTFSEFRFENLFLNSVGSVTDKSTGILHHHFLGPAFIRKHLCVSSKTGLAESLLSSDEFSDVKTKYRYLCEKLVKDMHYDNNLYFRWMRCGHPDREFPHVFAGEETDYLYELIYKFSGTHNFRLVHVVSKLCKKREDWNPEESLVKVKLVGAGKFVFFELVERTWTFDTFRGDVEAWQQLFSMLPLVIDVTY